MAITNHERVGKALELLKAGLGPSSSARSKTHHEDRWPRRATVAFLAAKIASANKTDRRLGRRGRCSS